MLPDILKSLEIRLHVWMLYSLNIHLAVWVSGLITFLDSQNKKFKYKILFYVLKWADIYCRDVFECYSKLQLRKNSSISRKMNLFT